MMFPTTQLDLRIKIHYNASIRAFSLVELSIVLVILGLLTGGILAGQSLIRAAELRAVTTEYQRYMTAIGTFRDKYMAIPGDMNNAGSFWTLVSTTASTCFNTVGTGTATCNGNGDGILNDTINQQESMRFWQHLANAGLIEGTYTGTSGSAVNAYTCITGTNCPASRLSNSAWSANYRANHPGTTLIFAYDYQNMFSFGGPSTIDYAVNAVLKPEEAWNVDTKLDDGKPATGKVVARQWNTCTNATSQTDTASNYLLTSSTIGCALVFPKSF